MAIFWSFEPEAKVTKTFSGSFWHATGGDLAETGGTPASGKLDIIEKYPFASDANAADVGDLTHTRENLAGQQV